ncbi:MAG: intradiol ring-cleavage dioxygenase [Methyloceanibacter sp.]|uniref:intradiol ring-cleavage dioxygenase n=1 Tax=Methyloceanibacter sp. TaxID=1965321 RepID=UPI003D9AD843
MRGSASALAKEGPVAGQPSAKVCVLTPEAMEGPFYFDPKLVRSDITEGNPGVPVVLSLQVVEAKDCAPLEGARIDVWHTNGLGVYSGYARQETGSTEGEKFLRGTQFTGPSGEVRFNTIYPGWYPGRTPHIHFKVFVDERKLINGQLYFPDEVTERVYATTSPYRDRKAARDTYNANDFLFKKQSGADTIVTVEQEDGSYLASLVIGVNRR